MFVVTTVSRYPYVYRNLINYHSLALVLPMDLICRHFHKLFLNAAIYAEITPSKLFQLLIACRQLGSDIASFPINCVIAIYLAWYGPLRPSHWIERSELRYCSGRGRVYITREAFFPIVSSLLLTSAYPLCLIGDRSSITLIASLANSSFRTKTLYLA